MNCSRQLAEYLKARRAGTPRDEACALSGLGLEEARLTDAAEDRGELEHIDITERPTIGHNSGATQMSENVAADQLRLFIERIERLEEEKKGIADDIRDVYAEAKSYGYDSKTMRAAGCSDTGARRVTPTERRKAVQEHVGKDPSDFTAHGLLRIANGGIMDPSRVYLPAGKLPEAEYREREARILRGEPI